MKAKIMMQFLLFFSFTGCFAQYGFDTVTVYFPINRSSFDEPALQKLDSLCSVILANNQKILIYGYADYLGSEAPNGQLSEARAQAVKAYLVSKGYNTSSILACAGAGQVKEPRQDREGNLLNRRTDIFVKRTAARDTATDIVNKKEGKPSADFVRRVTALNTGETMVLDNINFYPSSHQPLPESVPALRALIATLKQVPSLTIRIEGHICCIRDMDDALDVETGDRNLSTARAKFIYLFLIQNGIKRERLQYEGYGRRKPLIEIETTEEDAKANRRVEIRVLSK